MMIGFLIIMFVLDCFVVLGIEGIDCKDFVMICL